MSLTLFLLVLPLRVGRERAGRRDLKLGFAFSRRSEERAATTVFAPQARDFNLLSLTGFACPQTPAEPRLCRISACFVRSAVAEASARHQPLTPARFPAARRSRRTARCLRTAISRIQHAAPPVPACPPSPVMPIAIRPRSRHPPRPRPRSCESGQVGDTARNVRFVHPLSP